MKKFLMTIVAAVAAISVNAQVYLGGSVGFQVTSHDGNSTTAWNVTPEVGYTLSDDLAIGIALGYGEAGKDATKVKTLGVNPYLRYNFLKFDHVNIFFDGGFGFANVDSKSLGYKTNTWNVGLKPGVSLNLNENVSFVAHLGFLGFQSAKPDFDGAKATNTFGVDLDATNVNFGLYFNF